MCSQKEPNCSFAKRLSDGPGTSMEVILQFGAGWGLWSSLGTTPAAGLELLLEGLLLTFLLNQERKSKETKKGLKRPRMN